MDELIKRFLNEKSFSNKPMTFIDAEAKNAISNILDILIVETGDRRARERWQEKQLENLASFVCLRSKFWKGRLGSERNAFRRLKEIPVFSRKDLIRQVTNEGPLAGAADNCQITSTTTSGSSGTPVRFFNTQMNVNYNVIRSFAQFFMEPSDFSLNRTRLRYEMFSEQKKESVSKTASWAPFLAPLIVTGHNKEIGFRKTGKSELNKLIEEMQKDRVGYLACVSWLIEALLQVVTARDLKSLGTEMIIPIGSSIEPACRRQLDDAGVKVRSNYSCSEIGTIASECPETAGFYHVAGSNVIVECDKSQTINVNGETLGRILITHLHSYATPFIRYEVGDFGLLHESCPCGFDGVTLSSLYGHSKDVLSRKDGSFYPFHPHAVFLLKAADIEDFRIRQVEYSKVIAEFVLKDPADNSQIERLRQKLGAAMDQEMILDLKIVDKIDWGNDVKRLGFRNELINNQSGPATILKE